MPAKDPVSSKSDSIATILMLSITILLAGLILVLIIQVPKIFFDDPVPAIFEITRVRHTSENGVLNYDSYMVITNVGSKPFDNRKLCARTYRNGHLLPYFIPYINFNKFIYVHPHGIETIGGTGTNNYHWNPGATVFVDFRDGTIRPGDIIQFDVYDRETNTIVSRDIWPHSGGSTKKWMNLLFSRQAV